MDTGIKRLLTCPYCPGRRGVISVDLAASAGVRQGGPGGKGGPARAVRVELVFNPDGARRRACVHLVELYGGISAWKRAPSGVYERAWDRALGWCHPHFEAVDPRGDEASVFLWEVVLSGQFPAFTPAVPFRHRLDRRREWTGRGRGGRGRHRYRFEGGAVFALDPRGFLEELPRCYARYDAWVRANGI